MIKGDILDRNFYTRQTLIVAKELLGHYLVVSKRSYTPSKFINNNKFSGGLLNFNIGRIVETEAYLGHTDKAAHSYNKKTGGRTTIMFGEGGYSYVYLIYGLYYCFNIVASTENNPEGALIRALEPIVSNINHKIYSGPGKLCREFGITRSDYATNLCANNDNLSRIFVIKPNNFILPKIKACKRIGIDSKGEAKDYLYRFYDENSKSVSVIKNNIK